VGNRAADVFALYDYGVPTGGIFHGGMLVETDAAGLADLLTDRYDSVAAHPWRKHGVSSDTYAKLEEILRFYVKNEQAV
jgi:hypothetical protein